MTARDFTQAEWDEFVDLDKDLDDEPAGDDRPDDLDRAIASLARAAEIARGYGHAWAKELAHWLDAEARDADSIGADHHAVNFARAWIAANPAPEMSDDERRTWERFEAAREAHPDFRHLLAIGPMRPQLAAQYAALDLTFRADS